MNPRKKKILKIVAASVLLIGAAGYYITHRTKPQKITYHEDTVIKDDFTETIVSTGAVAPENRLDIKPPVAGRMDKLLVVEGQRVKQGQVLAWVSSTERAAMLDSARSEGPESLKQWETFYKATPIYAPINGIIILQNIWPGQTFATTDAILTMSDRLTVKAQVDETDIAKVILNQDAVITLDAYPNEKISAKVVHTAFDAKTVNSVTTYIVDVLPKQVPAHMLSGMTANVTFILKDIPDALLISNEAVQTENGISCVKVKPEQPELPAPCVPVTLGPSTNGQTVVTKGLVEDQTILIPDLRSVPPKNADPNKNPFMNSGPPKGMRH